MARTTSAQATTFDASCVSASQSVEMQTGPRMTLASTQTANTPKGVTQATIFIPRRAVLRSRVAWSAGCRVASREVDHRTLLGRRQRHMRAVPFSRLPLPAPEWAFKVRHQRRVRLEVERGGDPVEVARTVLEEARRGPGHVGLEQSAARGQVRVIAERDPGAHMEGLSGSVLHVADVQVRIVVVVMDRQVRSLQGAEREDARMALVSGEADAHRQAGLPENHDDRFPIAFVL